MANTTHDPEMTGVIIPEDILSKTFLGRCNNEVMFACSSPEAQYTDFNMWDRALTTEELVKWTTCKQVELVVEYTSTYVFGS